MVNIACDNWVQLLPGERARKSEGTEIFHDASPGFWKANRLFQPLGSFDTIHFVLEEYHITLYYIIIKIIIVIIIITLINKYIYTHHIYTYYRFKEIPNE